MKGVDFGWGRPGGKRIKDAGFEFVCRYLSNSPDKNLTRSEVKDYHAHGLKIIVVWETNTQRTLKGYAAGAIDARKALQLASDLGLPKNKPIYFAADDDFTDAQQPAINDYFKGVNSVLPVERIGIYGGLRVIANIHNAKLACYFWQTAAWSGGKWHEHVHIKQYGFNKKVASVPVDHNEAVKDDFGQW